MEVKKQIKDRLLIDGDDKEWFRPIKANDYPNSLLAEMILSFSDYNGGFFSGGLGYVFRYLEIIRKSSDENRLLVHKLFGGFNFEEAIEREIKVVLNAAVSASEGPDLPDFWFFSFLDKDIGDNNWKIQKIKCHAPQIVSITSWLENVLKNTVYSKEEVITSEEWIDTFKEWRDVFLDEAFQIDYCDTTELLIDTFSDNNQIDQKDIDDHHLTYSVKVNREDLIDYLVESLINHVASRASYRMAWGKVTEE